MSKSGEGDAMSSNGLFANLRGGCLAIPHEDPIVHVLADRFPELNGLGDALLGVNFLVCEQNRCRGLDGAQGKELRRARRQAAFLEFDQAREALCATCNLPSDDRTILPMVEEDV